MKMGVMALSYVSLRTLRPVRHPEEKSVIYYNRCYKHKQIHVYYNCLLVIKYAMKEQEKKLEDC